MSVKKCVTVTALPATITESVTASKETVYKNISNRKVLRCLVQIKRKREKQKERKKAKLEKISFLTVICRRVY